MKTWRGGGGGGWDPKVKKMWLGEGSQKSSKVVRGDYFSEVTFKEGGR